MSINLDRRGFLTGSPSIRKSKDEVRLPWLKSVQQFLDNCTQCESCITHCPENIIIKNSAGFPTINFELGECTFCASCAEHCPEKLFDVSLENALEMQLVISENCFPKKNIVCQSCRDVCEHQAISFDFFESTIPIPRIEQSLCTSCGACVSGCPADAISLISSPRNESNNKIIGIANE